MISLTFLGTTSMIPTPERNPLSMLLNIEKDHILVDCGEGTQRQLQIAKVSPTKINKIFISHWHGDHVLGIPGLIQTIKSQNKSAKLEIYGPKGTKEFVNVIQRTFISQDDKIDIKINEIIKESILNFDGYNVEISKLDHVTPTLGYSFIENDKRKINLDYLKKYNLKTHPLLGDLQKGKDIVFNNKKISAKKATFIKKGKKITFILDTKFNDSLIKFASNSDLLICESTFLSDLKEKAKEYKHLTANDASIIAKKSKSKKLILTHFSQRYKQTKEIEKEAKKNFKNTICAYDFLKVEI